MNERATKIRYEKPIVDIIAATEMEPNSAAALLIFTKHTRLNMDPSGYHKIIQRCEEDPEWMLKELDYMSKTIRSSWEFLDITFVLRNVSRACAQQITRTRFTPMDGDIFGSYAMQSQRVTDMSEVSFHYADYGQNDRAQAIHDAAIENAAKSYSDIVSKGGSMQDARGILPMDAQCNLVVKFNLRNLVDLIHARTSPRVQGEYRQIAEGMRDGLIELWPWSEMFLRQKEEIALSLLADMDDLLSEGSFSLKELRMLAAKVRDQIK